ncbi:MAG TPA: flagellar hook-associated protein FlgK [Burkholderiaceae bacterium]|nr:flagellar hook-associated protein FlgK [Burkholderiaceae bacterium]
MSTGIFSVGTSALSAAYTALRTAGNNVANASTPGYTRQIVVLTPQAGTMLGGSYVGQGVAVADVRRLYNDFLTQAAHQAQAANAQSETRSVQMSQVANLFADAQSGVGATIDHFFRQIQDLSQRPGDPGARQALLSAANLLADRFNDVGQRLQSFRVNTDTQIRQEVQSVNRIVTEIADLNAKISLAVGSGRLPNDLLDRRDAALRQLNSSVRVSAVEQTDGSINVFLANGQQLVTGSDIATLAMQVDPADPNNIQLVLKRGGAAEAVDSSNLAGGAIAGLLQFRNTDLPAVENELGRLAVTLADQFNIQHKLGDDHNGNAGTDLFTQPTPVAFAAGNNGNPATTISVAYTDTTQLQASDYDINYNGGQYVLRRLSDGVQWTSATPSFAVDGLSITLGSTPPAVGDRFFIQPVRTGSGAIGVQIAQPHLIAAALPVQASMPSANTGNLVVEDLSVVGPTRNAALENATTITFTAANTYTISDGVTTLTGQTYTPGTPITFNGWRLSLSGPAAPGDVINVGAGVGAVGDNRNALALSRLQNLGLYGGGALSGTYAAAVARIGGEAQSADVYASAQRTILKDALDAEGSAAGVNLDEEASRLIQYQQQYQAAAKVIATAKIIFDEILAIGR